MDYDDVDDENSQRYNDEEQDPEDEGDSTDVSDFEADEVDCMSSVRDQCQSYNDLLRLACRAVHFCLQNTYTIYKM